MMDKNVLKDVLSKKETRVYYLEHNFFVWCIYYFSKNFHYPTVAPFHRQRCTDVQSWINMYVEWFRESAKTMYIWLLYDLWCIVYKKKRFICAFSYEWKNASAYLFSIALELQTNQKLIDDYWQLFFSDNQEKKSQKKSINEFITENDIKLKAFSMWMSMRWQLFNARDWLIRPDSVVMDDIDVIDSVRNKDIIEKNYRFIKDEVFGALADYCQIRVLWNVILEDWLNPRIREDYRNNATRKIHSQWIYDKDWNITRDRFVETDIEADEYNKDIQDPRKKRISLEAKRKKLAEISFAQNFLWKPFAFWNTLIKRDNIQKTDIVPELDYIEVGIDPAFSEKNKSDEFSITITWFKKVDSVLYRYVLENINLVWEQKTNENMVNEIVNMYLTYKPRVFKVEENGGGIVLIKILRDRSQTRWYDLPIQWIKTTKDKFTRLKEFEWAFQRWEVYFVVWKTEALIEQLLTFDWNPKNTDDRVDSMIISFANSWVWFYFSVI